MRDFFEIHTDKFNSDNFRILMGNIILDNDDYKLNYEQKLFLISNTFKEAKKLGYKHLSIKIPTNDKTLVKSVINHGMSIADTLVRYTFEFNKSVLFNLEYKCGISDCKEEDLAELKDISRTVFKIDRFHSDESLPNDLCDQYYERWIENSFNGFADKVIVAHYNSEAIGYTTAKVYPNDEYTQLVLSAVSDKYKGLGTYTSMIHYGTKWLIENYSTTKKGVIVGTQIDNTTVQRAWVKLGYLLKDSHYVFQITL